MSDDRTTTAGPEEMFSRIEELSPIKRALLEQRRRARGATTARGIPRRAASGPAPASFAQELLWHLDRSTPGLSAYNVSRALRLRGPLSLEALRRAHDALIARHEALRTTFAAADGGAPVQVVAPPAPVPIEVVDLRDVPAASRMERVEQEVATRTRRPFDLATEPQFRVALLALADDDHVLVWVSHHIAIDGWSATALIRDFAALYHAVGRGEDAALPPIPISYADYAAWQREWLAGERLAGLLGYWRERLAGAPELLALPTDRPRPQMPSFEGWQLAAVLPPELVARLRQTAQRYDATLYMLLLAAYSTLLHRYSGQEDIVIGSPVAARARLETESVVGYFANTLVHRNDLSGDPTFGALLARVRETCLSAFEHQDVPLEKLVMELRRDRQLGHAPLFQCVLTMEDAPVAPIMLDGLSVESLELATCFAGSAKFDLLVLAAERPEGLRLLLQYRTDLFEHETAERMLGHLRTLLEEIAEDSERPISQLGLLTAAECEQLAAWNDTEVVSGVDRCVHALVEAQAARVPDRVAVVCGDDQLTYAELERQANRVARRLLAMGAGPASQVGICLDRSTEMVIALLAVLKVRGAYVPLPPELPAARVAQQLAESSARIVITRAELAGRVAGVDVAVLALDSEAEAIAAESAAPLAITGTLEDLAYVLFTSGSTGVPKGVAISQRNLAHYTSAISARLALAADEPLSFATVSTLGADLGNTAIFPALTSGGTLHIVPSAVALDGPRFAEYMTTHEVDVLKITPSHVRALMSACGERRAEVLPRKWLVVGGEACPWELVDEVTRAARCRVLNHYGPTETTVGVATYAVTGRADAPLAATVPIGVPLPNTRLHVLDAKRQPVPVGVPGELYVSGAGVARGYLNRPELTAERFVKLPGAGRAYRTGDRVRRLATGAIEFLGRFDDQVKIRGYRVELAEIEHALRQHPAVAQGAALLVTDSDAEARVVAYVVPKMGGYAAAHIERPTAERVTEWLAARLPEYMIPSAVVLLDALPLTPNGKLDRAALRASTSLAAPAAREFVPPRTETEQALAGIWGEVLKKERVGVTDDFLALGGHSLLAIRVLGKISRQFGVRLPLRTLFEAPTIAQLAPLVEGARTGASPATTGV